MYSLVFLITFGGAISNFGILLRQRIMMTPLVLMLICARQKVPERKVLERLQKDSQFTCPSARHDEDRIPTETNLRS